MGKGDKKSKKGKIAMGSYGVTRKRKSVDKLDATDSTSKTEKKPTEKVATKAKKAAPKKTAEK